MNKWKEIANIFEVELEEEFNINTNNGVYKFTSEGLKYYLPIEGKFSQSAMLGNIINGSVEIIKKPWKPKKGEKFYFYSIQTHKTLADRWLGNSCDLALLKTGNCFKTEEEALTKGKEIVEKLQKEYEDA